MSHIHNLFAYKVQDNFNFWVPSLPRFKRAMNRTIAQAYGGPCPPRYADCFATIDGKRFRICRPSGPNNQQAGAYNGYYGYHNLGFQSIVGPNGMFLQFSGPFAGAGNDLEMLAHSHSLNMLHDALEEGGFDADAYKILADKIYPQVYGNGVVSLRQQQFRYDEEDEAEDAAASSARVNVEHIFAKMVNLFPFLDFSKGLRVNERAIGQYVIVGALIINLHTCLYGSQVCSQFSTSYDIILPPTLESYMAA